MFVGPDHGASRAQWRWKEYHIFDAYGYDPSENDSSALRSKSGVTPPTQGTAYVDSLDIRSSLSQVGEILNETRDHLKLETLL